MAAFAIPALLHKQDFGPAVVPEVTWYPSSALCYQFGDFVWGIILAVFYSFNPVFWSEEADKSCIYLFFTAENFCMCKSGLSQLCQHCDGWDDFSLCYILVSIARPPLRQPWEDPLHASELKMHIAPCAGNKYRLEHACSLWNNQRIKKEREREPITWLSMKQPAQFPQLCAGIHKPTSRKVIAEFPEQGHHS